MRLLYTAGDKNDLGSLETFLKQERCRVDSSVGGLSGTTWGRRAACGLAAPAVRADRSGGDVSRCLVIPGLWG